MSRRIDTLRAGYVPETAGRMKFAPLNGSSTETSDCGCYELRPDYRDGAFAWRGRRIDTERLVASSADRSFVEQRCAWDAAAAEREAS